jgi:hypothetical protein
MYVPNRYSSILPHSVNNSKHFINSVNIFQIIKRHPTPQNTSWDSAHSYYILICTSNPITLKFVTCAHITCAFTTQCRVNKRNKTYQKIFRQHIYSQDTYYRFLEHPPSPFYFATPHPNICKILKTLYTFVNQTQEPQTAYAHYCYARSWDPTPIRHHT